MIDSRRRKETTTTTTTNRTGIQSSPSQRNSTNGKKENYTLNLGYSALNERYCYERQIFILLLLLQTILLTHTQHGCVFLPLQNTVTDT